MKAVILIMKERHDDVHNPHRNTAKRYQTLAFNPTEAQAMLDAIQEALGMAAKDGYTEKDVAKYIGIEVARPMK